MDWRYRTRKWIRRARLVCKELKIWNPFRQDTYSPATSPSMLRLLPHLFTSTPGWELRAFDVKDALLMVPQKETLYIRLNEKTYKVLKCLPGQQIAPVYWHEQLSGDLREAGMESNLACPVVFGGPQKGTTIHVDDGLMGGTAKALDEVTNVLKSKYKLEVSDPLRRPGDRLRFLKRTFEVVEEGLQISVDPKYLEKVVEILGITRPRSRKVPSTQEIRASDDSPPLSPASAVQYRAALGCILYIAPDRPDCQHTVSMLARGMSKPSEHQMKCLKYLAEYLYSTRDYALTLRWSYPGRTLLDESPRERPDEVPEENPEPRVRILEAISDSDWAGNKDRKSLSAGALFLDGNLMFSYARRQASISLSSCESELIASSSAIAEGLYLRNILKTLCPDEVQLVARLDSSSARAVMAKAGVSRLRHLDVRLLWVQGLVQRQEVQLKPISTPDNPTDIGTKPLHSERIRYLLTLMGFRNPDGALSSSSVARVHRVRSSSTAQHSQLLRLSAFLLAIALSRVVSPMEESSEFEASELMEKIVEMFMCMMLLSYQIMERFVMVGKLMLTSVSKESLVVGVALVMLVLGIGIGAITASTRTSSSPRATSPRATSTRTSSSPRATSPRATSTRTSSSPRATSPRATSARTSSSPRATSPRATSTRTSSSPRATSPRATSARTSSSPRATSPRATSPRTSSSLRATSATTASSANTTSVNEANVREGRETALESLRQRSVARSKQRQAVRDQRKQFVQFAEKSLALEGERDRAAWIASSWGECYHRSRQCEALLKVKQTSLVTVEEAWNRELAPCKLCEPEHWRIYVLE